MRIRLSPLHDRSALLTKILLDDAGAVGVDVVLHFHGFEDHERSRPAAIVSPTLTLIESTVPGRDFTLEPDVEGAGAMRGEGAWRGVIFAPSASRGRSYLRTFRRGSFGASISTS